MSSDEKWLQELKCTVLDDYTAELRKKRRVALAILAFLVACVVFVLPNLPDQSSTMYRFNWWITVVSTGLVSLYCVAVTIRVWLSGRARGRTGDIHAMEGWKKIQCWYGRHDYQVANNHPEGNMGYLIYECTRCHKAMVSDPGMGFFPIMNTETALAKKAEKAALRKAGKQG